MSGYLIALLLIIGIEVAITVLRTGRPRKPATAGDTLASLIEWGIIVALILAATG